MKVQPPLVYSRKLFFQSSNATISFITYIAAIHQYMELGKIIQTKWEYDQIRCNKKPDATKTPPHHSKSGRCCTPLWPLKHLTHLVRDNISPFKIFCLVKKNHSFLSTGIQIPFPSQLAKLQACNLKLKIDDVCRPMRQGLHK